MNANLLFKIISVWNLCSELVAIDDLKYEDGISGDIKSPGYPGNYPNNANFTWIIRTGSPSAIVTFRIIEMNIEKWRCDDFLEITEIEPCCFSPFKRCGQLNETTVWARGKKIRVSFISDDHLTDKGFHLKWRVTVPPTESVPEMKITTQKLLATTTTYRERTPTKGKDVKTTSFQQTTKTSLTSQGTSTVLSKTVPTPRTTESTTEYTSTSTYISPTTSSTKISESPSDEENSVKATNPEVTSELPSSHYIQHSQTSRTTLQKRSRPLTLASSSTVEVTTLFINTTQKDKNTFNIQTVYLVVGSVVIESLLLLVGCVWVNKYCKQRRSLQKNQSQQKRDNGTRKGIKSANWNSTVHVYETIPFDSVCGLEACPEETSEEMNKQSTLYEKCWRNGCDGASPAMGENYRDNTNTYETPERFYFTLEASQPPPLTQLATPRPTR